MSWVEANEIPNVVAGAVMLLLVAWLLYIDFGSRLTQLFALFFTLRGVFNTLIVADPEWIQYSLRYVNIAVPFVAIIFGIVFAAERLNRLMWAAIWSLVALCLAAEAAFFLDHSLIGIPATGPLLPLVQIGPPLAYMVVAVLLQRFTRADQGSAESKGDLLASAGMAMYAFFVAGRFLGWSRYLPDAWGNVPAGAAMVRYALAGFALVAVCAWWSVRMWRAGTTHALGNWARASLIPAAICAVAGLIVGAVEFQYDAGALWYRAVDGVTTLAAPVAIFVALLRYRLFGIETRARIAIRQSTMAAVFIAVFFVVSELAANTLSDRFGTVLGIVAAGMLVFIIAPLQRIGERIADAALHDTQPIAAAAALPLPQRLRIYHGQWRAAWRDGNLSADERDMLASLRDELGLRPMDVAEIHVDRATPAREADPVRELKPDRRPVRRAGQGQHP